MAQQSDFQSALAANTLKARSESFGINLSPDLLKYAFDRSDKSTSVRSEFIFNPVEARLAYTERMINTIISDKYIIPSPSLFLDDMMPDSSGVNKTRLIAVSSVALGLYIGGMTYLEYVWYKDHKRVPFHYYNDLRAYNQLDKFGHTFSSYVESYIGFHTFLWTGLPRNKAIWYGGLMGFFLQLPVEIWDGMYEGWGFSWGDVAANALGSAILIGQELAFREQLVRYKFSFRPSPYAPQANGYLGKGFDELFLDYNGHTYWFSVGLNRIIPSTVIPDWLNIAAGYGIGGVIGSFENLTSYNGKPIPELERYRKFLFSLDIDLTKIPTKNKFLKSVFNCMFMVKVPFPAVEFNTKGDQKFHLFYF